MKREEGKEGGEERKEWEGRGAGRRRKGEGAVMREEGGERENRGRKRENNEEGVGKCEMRKGKRRR